MIDIARKILLHDRLRFVITVSGVSFAVTLVLVQAGLFLGLLASASVTIEHADADLWVTSRNTANVDFAVPYSENYVQRVRSVPGVARADNLIVGFVRIALASGTTESMEVYALEHFSHWNLPWLVREGHLADLRRGKYFFLDDSARKRYGPFAVGEFREVNGRRLQFIGRTAEVTSFTTTPVGFMDFHLLQQLDASNLEGKTTYILVKLAPGADAGSVRAEIGRRLPYHDVQTRARWAQISRNYWIKSTGLGMSMFLTVFLGCLVGVVIVAQTLYTSVMDHFKEFATVKAIGGSNFDIYCIIAKQAAIAGVCGFLLGAGLSIAVAPAITRAGLTLVLEPRFFALVFVGTLIFCLAASAVSFKKISSLDPALVFRS
jgi:putative ABC transport system permease protein